ncbi:helix-turn-helix transcriptional regulator [Mesorhizobium sp. B2-4-17]|uniref:helix-turn-helix domain-containing protein n=1 Tax=Mesorhizobium sp. B2-4-17 TaxID=2589932 RepID=UPI00112BE931|nr:helix-turn-helix transcriptional regulator [Mesorhizobium sp. B2-4-17]TPK75287.1 helix-turn-helix transcriptional regulator [Mesorhizobium sp. B2-4-17]
MNLIPQSRNVTTSPETDCPLGGVGTGLSRFVLGPRDERFAIDHGHPSHAIEVDALSFDASSEREAGGMLVCVHQGEAKLLGAAGRWTLPAGHMVFIPSERSYRLASARPVHLTLVKFTRSESIWRHPGCWAVLMSPLAIEMASFARRWGADRDPTDTIANDFFRTMGQLLSIWFDAKRKMWTPFSNDPEMAYAIAFARQNLETASITDAAHAAGMSERTLRRRFKDELGISWREFINEARMSEAIKLLREGACSVTQTAYAVGFNSVGAFSVAFTAYTGSTPRSFARR